MMETSFVALSSVLYYFTDFRETSKYIRAYAAMNASLTSFRCRFEIIPKDFDRTGGRFFVPHLYLSVVSKAIRY